MANIIICIPDDYSTGGLQRSAINIHQALVCKGHVVSILSIKLAKDGYARKFSFIKQISPNYSSKIFFWLFFALNFRKVLKTNKNSVFLALGLMPTIFLSLFSVGLKVRGILGSERIFPPMETPSFLIRSIRKVFYRRLDFIVSQSEASLLWFRDHLGLPETMLEIIPNVIHPPSVQFNNSIDSGIRPGAYKNNYPLIACVGRLTSQKGFDCALQIFSIIHKRKPLAKMHIVGEGPDRKALGVLAHSLHIEDDITFISKIEDLTEIWQSADILLFPSRYEGFPNVLAEAMAHGLPAVSFNCLTGPSDLINHGENGYLVDVGDVICASELTVRLLEHHDLRNQLGSRAMNVAVKFSPNVIGDKWSSLIQRVSSKP